MNDSLLEIVAALRAYSDWQTAVRQSPDIAPRALREQLLDLGTEALSAKVADRRAHVRLRPIQLHRPMLARLKRGPLLTLLDVSAGGALIQTSERLNPGAQVLLEFLIPGLQRTTLVHSRVTRSHVAALDGRVRYRGGCSFEEILELSELLPRDLKDQQPAGTRDPLQAVRELLANARGLDKVGIARLLDDVQRMADASASRRALIAHVEWWLRSQVPLLALRVSPASPRALRAADVLSFQLPVDRDGRSPVNIEFRPACGLDNSQVRLLEEGASVMSVLYDQLADRDRDERRIVAEPAAGKLVNA